MQKITKTTVDLVKSFEGFRTNAYKCVASEKYYTIGYGHYGKDVKPTDKITKAEAEKLLAKDLERYAKNVNSYDSIYHWNKAEFDSLVSFAYNVGSINQLTANGLRDRKTIAEKMLDYCHSGIYVLKGLKNRRKRERNLFVSDTSVKKVNAISGLNVRQTPSIKGKKLCAIPKGYTITVLSVDNGWCYVDFAYKNNHYVGYVKGEYIA